MGWLLARLAEPSTWAGLAVLFTTVGQMVASGQTSSALIGGALTALGAVVVGEKGRH